VAALAVDDATDVADHDRVVVDVAYHQLLDRRDGTPLATPASAAEHFT